MTSGYPDLAYWCKFCTELCLGMKGQRSSILICISQVRNIRKHHPTKFGRGRDWCGLDHMQKRQIKYSQKKKRWRENNRKRPLFERRWWDSWFHCWFSVRSRVSTRVKVPLFWLWVLFCCECWTIYHSTDSCLSHQLAKGSDLAGSRRIGTNKTQAKSQRVKEQVAWSGGQAPIDLRGYHAGHGWNFTRGICSPKARSKVLTTTVNRPAEAKQRRQDG